MVVLLVGPALGYTRTALWQNWVYNSDGLSSGIHMHIISSQVPAFAVYVLSARLRGLGPHRATLDPGMR